MKRRVVITGVGAVTPIGIDVETYWNGLKSGASGAGQITQFDTTGYEVTIAAEIKGFQPENYMEKKEARRMDRYCQVALAAANEAVLDSGINFEKEDMTRVGVVVGSGIGGLNSLQTEHTKLMERGPSRVSPFFIPMMISNIAAGQISIAYGTKGPNTSVVTACATSTNSIGDAYRMIQYGDADVLIAGGTESAICEISIAGFNSMKALSKRNDDPTTASRPFDLDRDGFLMGEGAGIVILEDLEHAMKRGAKIYGEVKGYGVSSDAYHITAPAPDGNGAKRAMENAIADGGITKEEIDYVNAHGTSTPMNDELETLAIKATFGEKAKELAISSTKSMTGHLLGAAGAVEVIACLKTIENQFIHPTINYMTPDPKCDLFYVPNKGIEKKVTHALSNSFGFGGHNATLLISKFEA